jgi:hypothetical protein
MTEFFKRNLSNENIVDLEEMETRIRQEMARRYQDQVDNVYKYELRAIRKEIRELREFITGNTDMKARFWESRE